MLPFGLSTVPCRVHLLSLLLLLSGAATCSLFLLAEFLSLAFFLRAFGLRFALVFFFGSSRVVSLPTLRMTEDFIRLIDILKFFFGSSFVVGMGKPIRMPRLH